MNVLTIGKVIFAILANEWKAQCLLFTRVFASTLQYV